VVAGTGNAAAALTGLTASPASADSWSSLRQCESGGDYSINTGNGYYGAYQFSLATWRSLGYSGYPHQASAATQDAAAARLQARSGWGQWPACSAKLGLRGSSASAPSSVSQAAKPASVSKAAKPAAVSKAAKPAAKPAAPPAARASGGVPAYGGQVLSTELVGASRQDVRAWQARMAQRGWDITVDGAFGPQSEGVARAFQAEKGLTVDGLVGRQTWAAAWTAPVTG